MRSWLGRVLFRMNLPIIRRFLNGSTRVRIIISDEEKKNVVLVKNLLSRQKWTLPGGGVNTGESTEQAALRELNEELGLKLPAESLNFIDVFDHFEQDTKADWQAVIFRCSISKNTKLNHRRLELLKHEWFPLSELPNDMTEIAAKVLDFQGLGAQG